MSDYIREIAKALLFKPMMRSGLSANHITLLNFSTLGLLSIILFFYSSFLAGLLVAGLVVLFDNIDGEIARATTGNTKGGEYLDTSLDWLYLMLLIFSISCASGVLVWGVVALIAINYGNWVQYNGNVEVWLPKFLEITPILTGSILLGHPNFGIILIAIIQTIRTTLLYGRSVWEILET